MIDSANTDPTFDDFLENALPDQVEQFLRGTATPGVFRASLTLAQLRVDEVRAELGTAMREVVNELFPE